MHSAATHLTRLLIVALLGCLAPAFHPQQVAAAEHVVFHRQGQSHHVRGEVVAKDRQGGLLLLGQDGRMWVVKATEILYREKLPAPLPAQSAAEIEQDLLAELPEGFRVHRTAHFLICFNTSPAFAHWWGALAERLYRGFYGYWKYRGRELKPPVYPLVAIVFDRQSSYLDFCRDELGANGGHFIGHYSQQTNRVCTFDLTGIDALSGQRRRGISLSHIDRLLAQPAAERTVATIIHETTHQLAYNSGLQVRFADNPAWLSEGIATFFESPNLDDQRGWDRVGEINRYNLRHFRLAQADGEQLQLATIISSDAGFKDPASIRRSYAQAWALTYFLLRTRRQQFIQYLGQLGQQPPLAAYDPQQRLDLFRASFGSDLAQLQRDWLRYMNRLK